MEKSEIKIIWYMSWFKGTFKISFKMISSLIWKGSQSNKTRGWSRSQKRDCYVFKVLYPFTLLVTYILFKQSLNLQYRYRGRTFLFVCFGGDFSLWFCFCCLFVFVFFFWCFFVVAKMWRVKTSYIQAMTTYIPSQKGITYFHTIYDRE